MAIPPIPVNQRALDIYSRRFASIEKALAELLMDVISDEFPFRSLVRATKAHDAKAVYAVKLESIYRYDSEIHRSLFTA